MSSQTYAAIRNAILKKLQVVATYQGHVRHMCPHVLGTKNGKEQALFYQFGGSSSSGPILPGSPTNWRCIDVAGLSAVVVREGPWYTAENHSREQTCIDYIDVEVAR